MEQLTFQLLNNWNAARWIRLIIGVGAGIQAVYAGDTVMGAVSAFLLLQAFTNTGCCGNACAVNKSDNDDVDLAKQFTKPIEYTVETTKDNGNKNR